MIDLAIRADVLHARCGDWVTSPMFAGDDEIYTSLSSGAGVWMTDLPEEVDTLREAIEQAWQRGGRVLVTGLGLCLFPRLCLRSKSVERVTVIELNNGPIELVGRKWAAEFGDRLEIIQADAFAWRPRRGERFSVAWHDAWLLPNQEIAGLSLVSRFAHCCDWQGFWRSTPQRGA